MDTVEIVIGFEEAFGMEFPDALVETWETPRDVIEYVHANQVAATPLACLKMRSFHRLRRALEQEGLIEHHQLRLDTNLKDLLQGRNLREIWSDFRRHHALRLPELRRPNWLIGLMGLAILLPSAWLAHRFGDGFGGMGLWILVLAFSFGSLALLITQPLANCWPKGAETPRQLVEHLSMIHPKDVMRDGEALSREQIAETVRSITCEYCNPRDYREDAHFIKDLGLD